MLSKSPFQPSSFHWARHFRSLCAYSIAIRGYPPGGTSGGFGDPNPQPELVFWWGLGARRDHNTEPGARFESVGFRARPTKPMVLNTMAIRRWAAMQQSDRATI